MANNIRSVSSKLAHYFEYFPHHYNVRCRAQPARLALCAHDERRRRLRRGRRAPLPQRGGRGGLRRRGAGRVRRLGGEELHDRGQSSSGLVKGNSNCVKGNSNCVLALQVGSEINDGTAIDVNSYGNMTEMHLDEFRAQSSPVKV